MAIGPAMYNPLTGGGRSGMVERWGWTGRGTYLGTNKEVFGAEDFAILRAATPRRQWRESSTMAVARHRPLRERRSER